METKYRGTDDPVITRILKDGYSFSFFQTVYLLERYLRPSAKIGYHGPAGREIIRFSPSISLAFPSSDIEHIEKLITEKGAIFRIVTAFMGLYGAVSPLPAFYSEEITWNSQERDPVKGFLDIFHHRLISLFYRTWSKYNYHIQFEDDGTDVISERIFSLIGLGTQDLRKELNLPPVRLLRYAGILSQRPASASGLKKIISDYFNGIPVKIKECIANWIILKKENRTVIGTSTCLLGRNFILGEKVFDVSGKFRVSIGPIDFETFKRFLPDTNNYKELIELVKLYIKDKLDFDVELIIKSEKVPLFHLSSSDPVQLGWINSLGRQSTEDVSVVI